MEVIVRDDYECQDCGSLGGRRGDTKLHVHHKTPVMEGGTNNLENLTTLCESCHWVRHHTEKKPWAQEPDGQDDDLKRAEPDPDLPEGVPAKACITIKNINGNEYEYWQWRDGDKVRSKYKGPVSDDE